MGRPRRHQTKVLNRLFPGLVIAMLFTGCSLLEPAEPTALEVVPISAETLVSEGFVPALMESSPDNRLTATYFIWDQSLDVTPPTGSQAYLILSDNDTQQTGELIDFRNRRRITLLHWESADTLRVVNAKTFIWLKIDPLPGDDDPPQVMQTKVRKWDRADSYRVVTPTTNF